jgi:integrase
LIGTIESGFRNEKHIYQWKQTLGDAYCASIRKKAVDAVTTEDVVDILKPLWATKQETASRLRGRIEKVLDAAEARGWRTGENPARWRGHLDHLLPRRQKLQRGHQPALPYEKVPAFVGCLRARDAVAARALEFLILTAARSGEVTGATWSEIDLASKVWTVPADRMKAGREHRVPLSTRAIEILEEAAKLRKGDEATAYLIPSSRRGQPLSNMAFKQLLVRMGEKGFVPHGFRSSFRDWCGECTPFPREVAEAALAHIVGNSVEQAHRSGDALEKRRATMGAWAAYVSGGNAADHRDLHPVEPGAPSDVHIGMSSGRWRRLLCDRPQCRGPGSSLIKRMHPVAPAGSACAHSQALPDVQTLLHGQVDDQLRKRVHRDIVPDERLPFPREPTGRRTTTHEPAGRRIVQSRSDASISATESRWGSRTER